MGSGEAEHGKPLGDCLLGPFDQLRCRLLVSIHKLPKLMLSFVAIRGVEDRAEVRGHRRTHRHLRHILAGILLQVELAALPGNAREHRFAGRQTLMGVADDQLDTTQAAVLEI